MKLKWNDHISNLTKAVQKLFDVFNGVRFIVNTVMLYLSLVHLSHIEFAFGVKHMTLIHIV